MTAQQMADEILRRIDESEHQSFAELMQIEGARGEREIVFPETNLCLWQGCSAEFCAALEMIRPVTVLQLTSVLVYYADGMFLNLPIAKRLPRGGYKTLHWAPTVIRRKPARNAAEATT